MSAVFCSSGITFVESVAMPNHRSIAAMYSGQMATMIALPDELPPRYAVQKCALIARAVVDLLSHHMHVKVLEVHNAFCH